MSTLQSVSFHKTNRSKKNFGQKTLMYFQPLFAEKEPVKVPMEFHLYQNTYIGGREPFYNSMNAVLGRI